MVLYTTDKVAEILDVNPVTVRRWIRKGKLKANKIGKSYRIKKEDLEKFLDDNSN